MDLMIVINSSNACFDEFFFFSKVEKVTLMLLYFAEYDTVEFIYFEIFPFKLITNEIVS